MASLLNQFCQICLFYVEGQILFSISAIHVAKFHIDNGLVDTPIQKELPGTPGCLELCSMIWHTIQMAKADKSDLAVIWLDLANVYCGHLIDWYSLIFHVQEKVCKIVAAFYSCFKMRFIAAAYTTNWQDLHIAISMGCTIFPILLDLVMKVIIRAVKCQRAGVEIRPILDDLTLMNPSTNDAEAILSRLSKFMNWECMEFKAKKSRELELEEETTPIVSEKPVKSLGM